MNERRYGRVTGFHNPQNKQGKLPRRAFIKAAHLREEEGMPEAQAYAVAASYWRRGKLAAHGGVKKG